MIGGRAVLAGVLLLLCFGPALAGIAGRTFELSGYYDHLLLALGVSAAFFWQRAPALEYAPCRWGAAPLLIGLWLNVVGRVEGVLFTQVLGLCLTALGLVASWAGVEGVRALRFPLAYLLLACPVPRVVVDALTGEGRRLVTRAAAGVLDLLDVPAVSQGTGILIAGARVEVDPSCSGLQGLLAFVCLGALIARPLPGALRPALVLVSALVLALLANLLRVLALTGLVMKAPGVVRDGWAHAGVGLVVYALGLLALLGVRRLVGGSPAPEPTRVPHRVVPSPLPAWPLVALGAGAILAGVLPVLVQRAGVSPLPPVLETGPWRGEVMELPYPVAGGRYVRYRRSLDPGFVDLYTITGTGAQLDMHLPSLCFPGGGFEARPAPPVEGLPPCALIEVHALEGQRYLSAVWMRQEGVDMSPSADMGQVRLAALLRRLVLSPQPRLLVVRLVTPADEGAGGRLKAFSALALPVALGEAAGARE